MFDWIPKAIETTKKFVGDENFRNEVKEALWEDGCESAAALICDVERVVEKAYELYVEATTGS